MKLVKLEVCVAVEDNVNSEDIKTGLENSLDEYTFEEYCQLYNIGYKIMQVDIIDHPNVNWDDEETINDWYNKSHVLLVDEGYRQEDDNV